MRWLGIHGLLGAALALTSTVCAAATRDTVVGSLNPCYGVGQGYVFLAAATEHSSTRITPITPVGARNHFRIHVPENIPPHKQLYLEFGDTPNGDGFGSMAIHISHDNAEDTSVTDVGEVGECDL